jgi:hypothetical protein
MKAFLAALWICVVAVSVFAKANATLGGTARDATGGLVPEVRITAANVNTGVSLRVVTNENGSDPFASLLPFQTRIMVPATNTPGAVATGANNVNTISAGTRSSQGGRK